MVGPIYSEDAKRILAAKKKIRRTIEDHVMYDDMLARTDMATLVRALEEEFVMGMLSLVALQRKSEENINRAPYKTKQSVINMIWALQTELGELGNELDIKPWKKMDTDDFELERIIKECADVTAFYAAMMIAIAYRIGYTPEDFIDIIAKEYIEVAQENVYRHSFVEDEL